MKVKDLLEFLKNANPEDEIITYDPDEGNYYTCTFHRYKNYVAFEHHYSEGYEIVKEPEEY